MTAFIGFVGLVILVGIWLEGYEGAMVAQMLIGQETTGLPTAEFRTDQPGEQASGALPGIEEFFVGQHDITVDGCTWELEEVGGQGALNVTFSVLNESGHQLSATSRLKNSSGEAYEPGGVASEIAINHGYTVRRTLKTTRFPLGAEDTELVVSIEGLQDRTDHTMPLDQCTQWSPTPGASSRSSSYGDTSQGIGE